MTTPTADIVVHIHDGPLPPWTPPDPTPGTGATLLFEGIVRPTEAAAAIDALHYQTYEPMAQSQLHRLAADLIARHAVHRIHVHHSRGRVPAGACSFRLLIESPHRKEALAAMDEFIDRLKRDVPIWKAPIHDSAPKSEP